jgi:hypothetical protein
MRDSAVNFLGNEVALSIDDDLTTLDQCRHIGYRAMLECWTIVDTETDAQKDEHLRIYEQFNSIVEHSSIPP